MKLQTYELTPTDLLFFRDGRPMAAGEGVGHGARWPLPTVFFDALHAALHRAFPAPQPWEGEGHVGRKKRQGESLRFGRLRTVGPFPRNAKDGNWLFPAPLDARILDRGTSGRQSEPIHFEISRILPLLDWDQSCGDLPKPLRYGLGNLAPPSKEECPRWFTANQLKRYLAGEPLALCDFPRDQGRLFAPEVTTGIGIDPARDAQDGQRIYSAQYLRLKSGISLVCAAVLPSAIGDGMLELFPANGAIICGGQQRVCRVNRLEGTDLSTALPQSTPVTGNRIRWTLLTPAIFARSVNLEKKVDHSGGWLPSWVHPTEGTVMLPRPGALGGTGETRKQRRASLKGGDLDVKLVAACVGKPEIVTGWSDYLPKERGPTRSGGKSTQLAVPAGSVYYFEGPDAPLLQKLLSWDGQWPDRLITRSGSLAEKGLGLGVTSPWTSYPA
jgi:CRISPR type III-B/RAMP module-associated protein Cmr3